MPERLNSRSAREFLFSRWCVLSLPLTVRKLVFDLSLVAQIDAAGVEMLLRLHV